MSYLKLYIVSVISVKSVISVLSVAYLEICNPTHICYAPVFDLKCLIGLLSQIILTSCNINVLYITYSHQFFHKI